MVDVNEHEACRRHLFMFLTLNAINFAVVFVLWVDPWSDEPVAEIKGDAGREQRQRILNESSSSSPDVPIDAMGVSLC